MSSIAKINKLTLLRSSIQAATYCCLSNHSKVDTTPLKHPATRHPATRHPATSELVGLIFTLSL